MVYFASKSGTWRGKRTGSKVTVDWGGGVSHEEAFDTDGEAQRYLDAQMARRRADGFSEHEVPDDVALGGITWHDGPKGPGWLVAGGRIAHFEPSTLVGIDEVKIGLSVMVRGFTKYTGPDADRVHKDKFEVAQVLLQPPPKRKGKAAKAVALEPAVQAKLAETLKADSKGKTGGHPRPGPEPTIGQLVFTYQKGVFRMAAYGTGDGTRLAWAEPVFTLDAKRKRGPLYRCAADFCWPIDAALVAGLERLLTGELAG